MRYVKIVWEKKWDGDMNMVKAFVVMIKLDLF